MTRVIAFLFLLGCGRGLASSSHDLNDELIRITRQISQRSEIHWLEFVAICEALGENIPLSSYQVADEITDSQPSKKRRISEVDADEDMTVSLLTYEALFELARGNFQANSDRHDLYKNWLVCLLGRHLKNESKTFKSDSVLRFVMSLLECTPKDWVVWSPQIGIQLMFLLDASAITDSDGDRELVESIADRMVVDDTTTHCIIFRDIFFPIWVERNPIQNHILCFYFEFICQKSSWEEFLSMFIHKSNRHVFKMFRLIASRLLHKDEPIQRGCKSRRTPSLIKNLLRHSIIRDLKLYRHLAAHLTTVVLGIKKNSLKKVLIAISKGLRLSEVPDLTINEWGNSNQVVALVLMRRYSRLDREDLPLKSFINALLLCAPRHNATMVYCTTPPDLAKSLFCQAQLGIYHRVRAYHESRDMFNQEFDIRSQLVKSNCEQWSLSSSVCSQCGHTIERFCTVRRVSSVPNVRRVIKELFPCQCRVQPQITDSLPPIGAT